MFFLLGITRISIDPKVFDDELIFWKPEIRVIYPRLSPVNNSNWILILIRNSVPFEKSCYLFFAPTFISCADTTIIFILPHKVIKQPDFITLSMNNGNVYKSILCWEYTVLGLFAEFPLKAMLTSVICNTQIIYLQGVEVLGIVPFPRALYSIPVGNET